jgi:pimeloyl-ACP methyl ester carboxylesterase
VPGALARLLPAIWNTEDTLGVCMTPVVIVHGEKDRLFPAKMAQDLARACGGPCELVLVPELSHNTPIYQPELSYWSLVIARIANRP